MPGRVPQVGDRYMVAWRNGEKHSGDIIEVRPAKGASAAGPDSQEYYVHYPSFDRRLDEWVSYARVGAEAHEKEEGSKGRKRKVEEVKKGEKKERLLNMEKEQDEVSKVKNIQCISLGRFEIDAWYYSPFADKYAGDDKLHVCEFCLKYMRNEKTLVKHMGSCVARCPPGRQIYNDGELSMYEMDGKDHKVYCQNLCLLSKLFLDHKTLYFDVEPFIFYVLCEVDRGEGVGGGEESEGEEGGEGVGKKRGERGQERGSGDRGVLAEGEMHHIVGYFSKEKHSADSYNLACILTFPPYQRKGYGKFLMSLSYELTKREHTTGSPEKPLSDLGRISYRSFWTYVLLQLFEQREQLPTISMQEISRLTGFKTEDILSTLHHTNMIKFWKGQHVININFKVVENYFNSDKAQRVHLCKPDCLNWEAPTSKAKSGV